MTPRPSPGPASATTGRGGPAVELPAEDGSARRAVSLAIARLSAEFPTRRDPVVSATVVRCRNDLDGAPPGALPELVERLARQRLRDGAA